MKFRSLYLELSFLNVMSKIVGSDVLAAHLGRFFADIPVKLNRTISDGENFE